MSTGSRRSSQSFSYVLILWCDDVLVELKRSKVPLSRGYYIYVGSANIKRPYLRVVRHLMKSGKKLRWHVDYLTRVCDPVGALLCGGVREETLYEILVSSDYVTPSVEGFGCSDYRGTHKTHLFRFCGGMELLHEVVGRLSSVLRVLCSEIEVILN